MTLGITTNWKDLITGREVDIPLKLLSQLNEIYDVLKIFI